jgi:hypothetical protein
LDYGRRKSSKMIVATPAARRKSWRDCGASGG